MLSLVKNVCGQFGDGTLKLTVSEEWADGINLFFACWYRFTKFKSWSKNFCVGMVKNGCGQSGQQTLILTVSQKWTDGMDWIFAFWYKFRKAKSWFDDFWVGMVKNGHGSFSSWDPKICCILRLNLWIELIFWMLS